ncbi:hypothetical protein HDV02_003101 [Globomyces sp. JEL0801]|nr:hypothetical protein HDV02_003101 [Globomyces sp. JEL0801]
MANNQKEKQKSVVHRFREQEKLEDDPFDGHSKRPFTSHNVNSVKECEKWRAEIISEIVRKIEKIADPNMEDHRVREFNDSINQSMKEKRHWETRIKELGGPDYMKKGASQLEMGGVTVPGTRGYRYFGRAKELEGVKELFEQAAEMQAKISPEELIQRVDADYYGYRDEEDGLLLAYEQKREKEQIELLKDQDVINEDFASNLLPLPYVPSQQDIEDWMVVKRQQELVQRYLGKEAKVGKV